MRQYNSVIFYVGMILFILCAEQISSFIPEIQHSLTKLLHKGNCVTGMKSFQNLLTCNGRIDCSDGSDETHEACNNKKCAKNDFRCDYGACIAREKQCNGIFECADGSDENPLLCKQVQCIVPFPNNNTAYFIEGCEGYCAGKTAEDGSLLHFLCVKNETQTNPIISHSRVTCRNGLWLPQVPNCTDDGSSNSRVETTTSTNKNETTTKPANG